MPPDQAPDRLREPPDLPAADRLRRWVKRGAAATVLARARTTLPGSWVPPVVALRLHLDRRSEAMRRLAEEQARFLLPDGVDDATVAAVTERYLLHNAWRAELRWHPELITHQPVHGLEQLHAVRRLGRGVLISFLHHGPYDGALPSVARAGVPLHVVVGSEVTDASSTAGAPPFLRQHATVASSCGNRLVDVDAGSDEVGRLLRRGECVALALDVVGRSEVTFLGRRLLGSGGAARLAARYDTPVVPLTATRGTRGFSVCLGTPHEPRDHPDDTALLAALLRHHEAAVQACPEAYHHPTTRWGGPPAGHARENQGTP